MKNFYKNMSASGQAATGAGQLKGIVVNSHTSGTITVNDGLTATTAGVKGTVKLTMTDVIVPASHATATLTSSGAAVMASHGTTKLTIDAPVAGNYVTIGTVKYTAVLALTSAPYEILYTAGATAGETFLDNLKAAVNGTGTWGVEYSHGTAAHPFVYATTNTDTVQTFVARTVGDDTYTAAINAMPTVGTATRTSWEDTTFGGGTGDSIASVSAEAATFTLGDNTYTGVIQLSETSGATSVANQVLWETSAAVFLDNIKLAINAGATAGTEYSTATVVNPNWVAHTNTATTQLFVARQPGNYLNAVDTTETMANYAFGAAVPVAGVTTAAATVTAGDITYTWVSELSETAGATAITNQVLFGAATANALDNFKLAIDKGATEGTNYSTGTIAHPYLAGSTNSDTEQTLISKTYDKVSNSITVSTTLTNGTWGSDTILGGLNPAPLMFSTITLPATSALTTFDRFIKLGNADFFEGCYITIGGTADVTVVYN